MGKKAKVVDQPVHVDGHGVKTGVDLRLQRLFEALADQYHGRVSLLKEVHGSITLEFLPEGGGKPVQAQVRYRPNESGLPLVDVYNGAGGPVLVEDVPSAVLAVALR